MQEPLASRCPRCYSEEMARRPRSERQLEAAIARLDWETTTMVEFATGMVTADRAGDSAAAVAYFESLLIHLRNLTEFLLCGADDDKFAPEDFGVAWDRDQPERAVLLTVANHDIQAHLAHLLWRGVEAPIEPGREWDALPHVRAMLDVFRRFAETVPEAHFAGTLHAIGEHVRRLEAVTAPTGRHSFTTTDTQIVVRDYCDPPHD